ncbi:hypothetical protein KY386_04000, partial [Candidatus Parcubacteria bacterium]|nr:hypothetical protein [Candidatus Parcubacteria bacterium]
MRVKLDSLARCLLASSSSALQQATWFWRTGNRSGEWVARSGPVLALISLLAAHFLLPAPPPVQAAAGVNQQINFQARLLNAQGATVPDGNYNIEFKIYQDGDGCNPTSGISPCGGTLKWTEAHLNSASQGVRVVNGYFSVYLGSVTSLSSVDFNQDTLWLSINIGGTGATASYDGEMKPFKRFSSNPYALNSGKLQGLDKTQFVQLAQGLQVDASTTNASIAINKTGTTANILQLQRGGADVLLIDNAGKLTYKPQTDSTTALEVKNAAGTVTVLDIDTTNQRVGIGTAAPAALLSVGASSQFQVSSGGAVTAVGVNAGTGLIQGSGGLTVSGAVSLGGATSVTGSNTLTVGTGATSLGGALTVSGNATFSGAQLTNSGSTRFGTLAITDLPLGGDIGTATATVDIYTAFNLNQTTAGQTVTIPAPTVTTAGRVIYLANVGTANFTLLGSTVSTGTTATMLWNGTAWTHAGADGSAVLNQKTTDQNANFRISGFGQANTAFISPLFKTNDSSGGSNTANITLQSGDANSGNNNASGAVVIKSGDAANGNNGSTGNITIDAGLRAGTGTAGSINIGTVNAGAINLGRTGVGVSVTGGINNNSGSITNVGNITGAGAVTLQSTAGTLGLTATGANVITASTNGTERLRVSATGNLGLGTTSPTALLHMKGNLSSALTGTVAVTNLSTTVTGTGTAFTTELSVGDSIKIGTEVF